MLNRQRREQFPLSYVLLCSPLIFVFDSFLFFPSFFFFLPFWRSVSPSSFPYLSTHQLYELCFSAERTECIITPETRRKGVSPLRRLELIPAFTISLKLVRDRRRGGRQKEPNSKILWRTCQRCRCPCFSAKTLCDACPSFVYTFCLAHSFTFINFRALKRVLMLSRILFRPRHPPGELRVNRVYHCRTRGPNARAL